MDAEPKRYTYLDTLWQSFYSQSLYIDVAKRWRGGADSRDYLHHGDRLDPNVSYNSAATGLLDPPRHRLLVHELRC